MPVWVAARNGPGTRERGVPDVRLWLGGHSENRGNWPLTACGEHGRTCCWLLEQCAHGIASVAYPRRRGVCLQSGICVLSGYVSTT